MGVSARDPATEGRAGHAQFLVDSLSHNARDGADQPRVCAVILCRSVRQLARFAEHDRESCVLVADAFLDLSGAEALAPDAGLKMRI